MKVSICIPYHDMQNGSLFMKRCIDSIKIQSFRDFEIVLTKEGKMAENTNAAIKRAKGEIIKILYMDDYFAHPNSLQEIIDNFKGGWLVSGCEHDDGRITGERFNPHYPTWNDEMKSGKNTIGSPSVLAFENTNPELFDVNMSWLLDCDLYVRLYKRFGLPTFLNTFNVVIGLHEGQMTHLMSDEDKLKEHHYLQNK